MSDPSHAPHVARYLARLDAHLPTLADDAARRAFLGAEFSKWIDRYECFQSLVDAGDWIDDGTQAADYVITMAEISARLARLAPGNAEAA